MNAVRLTYNVLRLSGPLRCIPPAFQFAVLNRFAHKKTLKKPQSKIVKDPTQKPTNHDIKLELVQVADVDGKLAPFEPLSEILARVDLKKVYVEQVALDKPIVKIFDRREQREKAKARHKAEKARMRANEQKEIQLTWGVEKGDLVHKLGKARKELEKSLRVEIVFAGKSKQPLPLPEEQDQKVSEVLEFLKDVGMEWQPRTFRKSILTIHLRPIDQK